ncbi:MAG: ADP-ribosylglycohydrolase family protein [Thermoproteota archaeon]
MEKKEMVHVQRKLMKAKFIGSLVGTAVGDSLGARFEGSFGYVKRIEIASRYTDDTAMMIGMAESLIEVRGFDGEHMAKKFVEDYEKEPWRGYGPGPPLIFKKIKAGRKWDEELDKEIFPDGSFGNGAAMRIAPIGLYYYDNPEKLREIAYESSKITHSNPLGMEGAALQAYAVALFLIEEKNILEKLMNFTKNEVYRRKLKSVEELLGKKENRMEVVRKLGNGVEAFNSVPTAIYSTLANSSFEGALTYAISLGGDADTIGAMTEAIAGAYYGIDGIPMKWKDKLENRKYIESLGEKLWEIKFLSSK